MHTKGELPVQGALPKQQHPREGQVFSWLAGYCAVRRVIIWNYRE